MGVFTFVRGIAANVGVGVADLKPQQLTPLVPATPYGVNRNVRRHIVTQSPGMVQIGNAVIPVALTGYDGQGMQGTFRLTPLAKREG
jgi:hypothetical protein